MKKKIKTRKISARSPKTKGNKTRKKSVINLDRKRILEGIMKRSEFQKSCSES